MGKINLLKNGYRGKVGQTVGQQWNGQLTLRTHNEHNNSKSQAQLDQRATFGDLIKGAQQYYPMTFNYNPPKNYSGTKWNYLTKGLKYLQQGLPQPGQPVQIYPDQKAGLLAPYCIYIDTKIYAILINQHEHSTFDYNSIRFYGLAIPGVTSDPIKTAFETARPRYLKKNFPNAAALGIHSNTVLVETPLSQTDRDILLVGIIIKKGSTQIYTNATYTIGGLAITEDQLTDWD